MSWLKAIIIFFIAVLFLFFWFLFFVGFFNRINNSTPSELNVNEIGQIIEKENIEKNHYWQVYRFTAAGDTLVWICDEKPRYFVEGTAEFKDTSGTHIACRYDFIRKMK